MLEDAAAIRKVVIACGYVDLRKGIDGLSMIIGDKYRQNPFEKGTLFLFNRNLGSCFLTELPLPIIIGFFRDIMIQAPLLYCGMSWSLPALV